MTTAEVLQVLSKLANGIDPVSGMALPRESPCNQPYVIRALFAATEQLKWNDHPARYERPANAGSAWSAAEEQQLATEMAAGTKLMDIARAHGRSRGAILSRTVHLRHFKSRDDARAALEHGLRQPSNWDVLKKDRPQAGKTWSADEDASLLRDFDAGLHPDEIAKRLGRGVFAVRVRLCKLGEDVEDLQGAG